MAVGLEAQRWRQRRAADSLWWFAAWRTILGLTLVVCNKFQELLIRHF